MIPNTAIRLVSSSPIAESAEFGISVNDTAHIMSILRDQLYSDKILAVLREYGSNAWDAHRDAGKAELPIKVTLPTAMSPTLSIRDFGLGLSPDAVFRIFTQYGASTKRNSDNSVGMLGIGSKSGFAYSDSFTVVSFYGGSKRTYVAVLDPSEKGLINLLHEEPCGEETGVEISIAVRPEDLRGFEHTAKGLFKYFIPRPDINTELPKLPPAQSTLKHGVIYEKEEGYYSDNKWVAVMGCVSYNINLDQLRGIDATPEGGVASFLSGISGALYFNIGEVQVSASREELKYSSETKLALVKKFSELVEEYVKKALDEIMLKTNTPWERRVKAQVLAKLHLPVPADTKDLLSANVALKDHLPKGLVITQNRTHITSIAVHEETRFILHDDPRSIQGFAGELSYKDYFVRAVDKAGHFRTAHIQWDAVELKVREMSKAADVEGIPVIKLSSLPWVTPSRNATGRKINPKHRMKVFKYLPEEGYSKPWSDCWEAVDLVPSQDDVFVVIQWFQTQGFNIGEYYRADTLLAELAGVALPTIYAYKATEKKPVDVKDCLGTHYPDWRKKWVTTLLTQQVKDQFALLQWVQSIQNVRNYWRSRTVDKRIYDKMVKELGDTHTITLMVKNIYEGQLYFKQHPKLQPALASLENRLPELKVDDSPAHKTLEALNKKYPLFTLDSICVAEAWGERSADWLQYIKLIDKG
jgi:hypothetical protein